MLKEVPSITSLIPATFPIDTDMARGWLDVYEGDNAAAVVSLASYIRTVRPALLDEVTTTCGAMPWIIRSSGNEDKHDFINAGAYLSLVCNDRENFFDLLSEVMLSGRTERALTQSSLFDRVEMAGYLIPVFIQPLVNSDSVVKELQAHATPYLSNADVQKIERSMEHIHLAMEGVPLDCEWVAETDFGIVSMTSLTEYNGQHISGQLACGFNLFSAQHVKSENSVRYILQDRDLDLWQGRVFQEVQISRLHLVQVRPAANYQMLQNIYALDNANCAEYSSVFKLLANEVILHGKIPYPGKYLKSLTLNDAWNSYMNYSGLDSKEEIAAVFVEIGSRMEHAGIMFSQLGIPVFRLTISNIPETFDRVLVDPYTKECRFFNGHIDLKAEYREMKLLPLSDQCLVIHSKENHLQFNEELELRLASPIFDNQLRQQLIQNSTYPSHRFIMYGKSGGYSPTLFERMLSSGNTSVALDIDQDKHLEEADEYRQAWLYAHDLCNNSFLENCSLDFGLDSNRGTRLITYWKILRLKSLLIGKNKASLSLVMSCLQEDFSANKYDMGIHRLDLIHSFHEYIYSLPIYNYDEINNLCVDFYKIVSRMSASELHLLDRLCNDFYFNAGQLCRFMNEALVNKRLFNLYDEFSRLNAELALSNYCPRMMHRFESYTNIFKELWIEVSQYESLGDLLSSFYQIAVELFDHTAKELLLQLSEKKDDALFQGYLTLLEKWLLFINVFDKQSNKVLQTFVIWLQDQRQHEHHNYFLEEIHWKTRLQDAEYVEDAKQLSLTNPHQLHNVLHQWSLSLAPASNNDLQPQFLRQMINFANTFSEQENRLLRSQKDFFEIQLSMCTHKAGFTFYSSFVLVEFSEPPSVEDDEVARLIAFTKFIIKFNDWFEDYHFTSRYEKVVGTWTSFISVARQDKEAMSQTDFKKIFEIIRFMLDSSYDFSHTNNDIVDNLEKRFDDIEWKEIFNKLVEYRIQYDDSNQFINVHMFAMASFLTNICISTTLRDDLIGLYHGGFPALINELLHLESPLSSKELYSEWFNHYEKATFISLLLSAVWPKETLGTFESLFDKPNVFDILCKNLFRRKDVFIQIFELYKQMEGEHREIMLDKMLHYCPDWFINHTCSIEPLLERLLKERKRFKRAKQYLIHAHAHLFKPEWVVELVNDIQYVPYGKGLEQEQQLVASTMEHKLRYDITKEVLYINSP